jgi:hypothetical protein
MEVGTGVGGLGGLGGEGFGLVASMGSAAVKPA